MSSAHINAHSLDNYCQSGGSVYKCPVAAAILGIVMKM